MIIVNVKCPHCKKSLINNEKLINKKPTVMVKLTYAGKKDILYLSAAYGNYNVETNLNVPKGKIAGFRCPHCNADLKSTRKCDICNAPMVSFDLKDGGQVQICSRRGCKKHIIEFEDPSKELDAFYKSYIKAYNE